MNFGDFYFLLLHKFWKNLVNHTTQIRINHLETLLEPRKTLLEQSEKLLEQRLALLEQLASRSTMEH